MLGFQHIEFLFALMVLPVLAALYYYVLVWKKRTLKKIGDERLVREITSNYAPQRFALKFLLILLAFTTAVFALANLRSPIGTEKVTRNGIDVMIALDVSKSMLAQDIKPSRLERARQVLGKLIDKRDNDRFGIVVFAGRAYLQMPLTGDHGASKMYLSSASPDIVPTQGTVIGDALRLCAASFDSKEKKYKVVVLISDGEDHDEGALSIAGQMAGEGVVIHTIGIGSPEGATIIDESTHETKKDQNGNTVITKLNEAELKNIAGKCNGIYQLYNNTDEVVSKLDTQLGSMDQRAVTEDALVNYKNYFQFFLLVTLVVLVIEMGVSEKIRTRNSTSHILPALKKASLLLIAYCLLPAAVFSQNPKQLIKKGNDAYEKKEYDKAIADYQKVTGKDPVNTTAQYNLGNALYRSQKADEAITAYENALSGPTSKTDRSMFFYNKGVVLQHKKKLPECIDAYKNALKLNPGDEDARQNLQKALQQQHQQQQEKKDKEQNKPKNDDKQKEKQKPKDEDKNNQPKPQPSRLTKQDAEEKLKALLQQEKNLQDKLKKVNEASLSKPEKDW